MNKVKQDKMSLSIVVPATRSRETRAKLIESLGENVKITRYWFRFGKVLLR